jgi:dipeptidyl aminopeptidase/acylaminoacyl peptidase
VKDAGQPPARSSEGASGWWPSPWPASVVAAGKVSRSGLQADGGAVYWLESRPDEGGRQVVVRAAGDLPPAEVSFPEASVRSRVHEYGGGAATVANGVLFHVDQADQGWHRMDIGALSGPGGTDPGPPVPLLPTPPARDPGTRYADGRITRSGRWLVSVEERLHDEGADHRLVAVAAVGSQRIVPLVEERDFVAAPRPSRDGRWLAWVTWDHPHMPWDSSEVWVARIDESDDSVHLHGGRRVAGGRGTSVGQPLWCRDGSLLFVDDRNGWWLPYRLTPEQLGAPQPEAEPLVQVQAEFHAPDWVLGQATMAELSDGSIVCRRHQDGRDELVRLRPSGSFGRSGGSSWSIELIAQPCVGISGVVATGPDGAEGPAECPVVPDRVFLLGSTATEAHSVFEVSLDGAFPARRMSAPPSVLVSIGDVSVARPFIASTPAGPVPGLFFPPTNAQVDAGATGLPPLVVFCHGGPTASAEAGFDPVVQFFTSRGLAVAIVDYRGSSGYGRVFRRRLEGLWGEADVDDCVNYAGALDEAGWVDGGRMAIRGTSAGGLTALAGLIRATRFAGAVAWYGVTDLEALAADTHDFESRYVDSLVGPWPGAEQTYRDRSPIHHPDRVSGEVLLLQGADDHVVPPDQSERFAAVLGDHGVQCRLIIFEGEAHGFRRVSTIETSLDAELDFYRSLFDGPAR